MPLTYRRQPAVDYLVDQGWNRPALAAEITRRGGRCTAEHLISVFNGRAHPSRAVREHLPEILGVPLDDLFDADLLARVYAGPSRVTVGVLQ